MNWPCFKSKEKILPYLIIPLIWLPCFTGLVFAQSVLYEYQATGDPKEFEEIGRRFQDYDVLKRAEDVYKKRISNLEKEIELKEKELALKDQMIELKDREIQLQKENFDKMQEIGDRAIKLAESKKPNFWETYGPLAVIASVL